MCEAISKYEVDIIHTFNVEIYYIITTPCIKTLSVPYIGLSWINLFYEGHGLLLRADHANDLRVLSELQLGDALKALFQVRLHTQRVFSLGEDL